MDVTKFSLNAGELSDEMAGRPDLRKTQMGCEKAENVRVLRTGGLTRRAGFEYGADSLDAGAASRLKGFRFDSGQGYVLEFGNLKMRVWKDGVLIESAPSTPLEVVTPWTSAQIFDLQFAQRVNRIVVTHPDVEPYEITFTDSTTWAVAAFPWQERIWVPNANEAAVLTPAATTGNTTISSDINLFDAGWVGTRLQLEHTRAATINNRDTQGTGGITTGEVVFNLNTTSYTAGDFGYQTKANASPRTNGRYNGVSVAGNDVFFTCIADYDHTTDYTGTIDPNAYPTFFEQGIIAIPATEVQGKWEFETFGTWRGTYAIERSYDGGTNWSTIKVITSDNDNNELVQDEEAADANALFRVLLLDHDNTNDTIEFRTDSISVFGIAEITAYNSATSVDVTVEKDFEVAADALSWKEDAFNPKNGYASACTFHQRRLWFGGSTARPQSFWSSKTEEPYNFTQGTLATDGMSFETDSEEFEDIRNLSSHLSLLVGTSAGVWAVVSPNGQSLTPENNQISRQVTLGAARGFQMVPMQSNVLYLQDKGRKIQELTGGSVEYGGYTGVDMTQLASHITRDGVVQMEPGKVPDSAIFMVTGTELAVLTYERAQEVVGWSRWITDGSIESVGVCSGASEDDDIYICVNRSTGRHIERISPDMLRTEEAMDMENLAFLDSFVRKTDGGGFTVFDGLDHLNGETVQVFADGERVDDATVSGGQITLAASATNAIAGRAYTTLITPMPLDRNAIGNKASAVEMTIRFRNSLEGQASQNGVNWTAIAFPQEQPLSGDPPPDLFTGDKKFNIHSTWEYKPSISIRQTEPLPMTVLAMRVRGKTSN
jgi:hypothetical protein